MWFIILVVIAAGLSVAQIKMPAYQRVVLENGAVLFLMPKKDLPLVSLSVSLRGGAESDPGGMQGLAAITTEMLLRGTANRTRERLAEDMDQLGITARVGTGKQFMGLGMQFLSKDFTKAEELLEDVLLHPSFAENELKRLVEQKVDGVKVAKDRPQMALMEYFSGFYFGKEHPYGRSTNGDELSLPKINREAVEKFWKTAFVGKNLVIVAAGDFDPKTIEAQLRKLFEKLPSGTAYLTKNVVSPKLGESRLLLVDLPGATQTYFAIAQPGIERTNVHRTPLELVNTLFGGRFTSMLNDALRVDSGLTYGANSVVQLDRLPGAISIMTFTKTETTEAAMDLALKQLEKLQTTGIDSEQLASAKAYVKGEYPTKRLETIDQLSAVLTDMEVFGLNRGEVDDLISRIDSVTLEQANAIARRYYKTSGLVFVLVGDAAKIRKTMDKYAKDVRVVKISEPGF